MNSEPPFHVHYDQLIQNWLIDFEILQVLQVYASSFLNFALEP